MKEAGTRELRREEEAGEAAIEVLEELITALAFSEAFAYLGIGTPCAIRRSPACEFSFLDILDFHS